MISVERESYVGKICLNRVDRRNALHPIMMAQVVKTLNAFAEDKEVKTVFITGTGSSFCSGADLQHLLSTAEKSFSDNYADAQELNNFFNALLEFPKPLIAYVNGPALAGGCGLALACDIILADSKHATFGFPEVNVGFIPAIVSGIVLRHCSIGAAKYLMVSGDNIDAPRAHELGLAHKLIDGGIEEAMECARAIAKKNIATLIEIKKMFTIHERTMMPIPQEYLLSLNLAGRYGDGFTLGINSFLKKGNENG